MRLACMRACVKSVTTQALYGPAEDGIVQISCSEPTFPPIAIDTTIINDERIQVREEPVVLLPVR